MRLGSVSNSLKTHSYAELILHHHQQLLNVLILLRYATNSTNRDSQTLREWYQSSCYCRNWGIVSNLKYPIKQGLDLQTSYYSKIELKSIMMNNSLVHGVYSHPMNWKKHQEKWGGLIRPMLGPKDPERFILSIVIIIPILIYNSMILRFKNGWPIWVMGRILIW